MKTILINRDTIQPDINNLVFEMNDLVIHTYQFIRLYILYCYTNNNPLPELNDIFISYCIKTLGFRLLVCSNCVSCENKKLYLGQETQISQ